MRCNGVRVSARANVWIDNFAMYSPKQNIKTMSAIHVPGICAELHGLLLIGTYEWRNNVTAISEKSLSIRRTNWVENGYDFMSLGNCKDIFEHEIFLHENVLYQ